MDRKLKQSKAVKSCNYREQEFQIKTDTFDGNIPLLLSKSSMERENMKINFQDDTITILDANIPLMTTSSGHHAIPITKAKQIINRIN